MAHQEAGPSGLPQRAMAAKVGLSLGSVNKAYAELGIETWAYIRKHYIPNAFNEQTRKLCVQIFLAAHGLDPDLINWWIFSDESHFELEPQFNSKKMVLRCIGKPEIEDRIIQRKVIPNI